VNGSVLMEGKKMSKSFGNIVPLREAVRTYGADPLRASILGTAELMQDADFSTSLAGSTKEKLERIYESAMEVIKQPGGGGPMDLPERWLLSRLQRRIGAATNAMERFRVREAVNQVVYEMDLDLQWYRRWSSVGGRAPSGAVLRRFLEARIRMMAPFAPHLAEEIWEKIGGEGLIAHAKWPEANESEIDAVAEETEDLIRRTLDDTADIIKVTALKPKRIIYYTAAPWKWNAYSRALVAGDLEMKALMKDLMKVPELKERAKDLPTFVQRITEDLVKTSEEAKQRRANFTKKDEFQAISHALKFFEEEFKARAEVFVEEDESKYDPKGRARLSLPLRPAIYIE